MAKYVKPIFTTIWASEGSKKAPSQNQTATGWGMKQFPPSDVTNYQVNKIEANLAYLNQMGISEWDKDTEYQVNSYAVLPTTGMLYRSKTVNTGKNPSTSGTDWEIPFDKFGTSDDIRATVTKIMGTDGHIPFYVRKSDPVMSSTAKAPAFRSSVGAPAANSGFNFDNYNTTGLFCQGGELLLAVSGVVNGRIKQTAPTMEMNDNTLVTTALLKKVIDDLWKKTQIPVGWSVITKTNVNPATALGYGTWVQDMQGKALVGVMTNAGADAPDWIKYADSTSGDSYTTKLAVENLPPFRAPILLQTWVGGDDASGEGAILTANREWRSGTQYPDKSFADFKGENVPFSNVQPSQTKFIWTRTA